MRVELTPDAEQWAQTAFAAGRFPTAEDAVRYAMKRAELRDMLEAEGRKAVATPATMCVASSAITSTA